MVVFLFLKHKFDKKYNHFFPFKIPTWNYVRMFLCGCSKEIGASRKYKIVRTFEFLDEIPKYNHSFEGH